ncbi:MAG: glycosyltransferase [Solirubrobacterales bacterium]
MKQLRVLQVSSRYRQLAGEQRVLESDADLLRAAGHEVRQFEASNDLGTIASVASLAASTWNLRQAARIRRAVDQWRPDIAHLHNLWFSLSPSVIGALGRAGVPTVLTIHNYRLQCVSADLWRDGAPCEVCVGRKVAAAGVVHGCYRGSRLSSAAVSSASLVQRSMIKRLPAGCVNVPSGYLRDILVRDGFDKTSISVTPWSTADPGERTASPSNSGNVYFVGRLEPGIKGVERLVSRWNEAKMAGLLDGLTLNLIGSGPLAGSPLLAGRDVISLGELGRHEIDQMLLLGRALICPAAWAEPFGLVAIEAFAAGLPVLGSERGALPETIGLLGEECLLPLDDENAWTAGLAGLEDGEFVDRIGALAREVYEAEFSQVHGTLRLEAFYREALRAEP